MKKITALIPTYGRPSKLEPLLKNFAECSSEASIVFIYDPADLETKKELNRLYVSQQYTFQLLETSGEYVRAINFGAANTTEPFVFCGADDIMFSNGWDVKLLKVMDDQTINVTGGIDDWTCSRSGVHVSHPLIRRSYIEEQGASLGGKGILYSNQYKHYYCDIEMEQVAWARNCFKLCKDVTIEHNHFVNGRAVKDDTYTRSYNQTFNDDKKTYGEREKDFEWWDLKALHAGFAQESDYRVKKLSVIMPIWNCADYTEKTLDSLLEKTKNCYELILIDDRSTEFDGIEFLAKLEEKARKRFLFVKTEVNKEQKYCNANWNRGVELATGDYIAIINSDIEFDTNEWDDYLMENIDLGYTLVNPYQRNKVYPGKRYGRAPNPEDVLSTLNICGCCFMTSKAHAKKVFPIPKELKHWCGDNHIARNSLDNMFDIRVSVFHHISKSGEKVDQVKFWTMVYEDVQYYEVLTGEDLTPIANNCKKRLQSLTGQIL